MAADHVESLKNYYNTLFPYQLIQNWLDYNDERDKNLFKTREFSLTLPGDIYIRYQSFDDGHHLKRALVSKIPIKIDAGPIYTIRPTLRLAYPGDFKLVQRELTFDIDISDYNDVRTCCKESEICQKCWPLMSIGAKILNKILTSEFGFKHLLFVFSGRRGFHCWVCDREARMLNADSRKAIADYFTLVKGGDNIVKRVELDATKGLHPMIQKSLAIIDEQFEDLMVNKQDFLSNDHLVQNIIDLAANDVVLQTKLRDNCRVHRSSSSECWNAIKSTNNLYKGRKFKHNYFLQEVKLQHCYPRLDTNVTRGMNHLLKMPFCVHPKTGNVCVPLDIDQIDNFQLSSVPNVKDMSRESLDPYVKIMKRFCDNLRDSATISKKESLEF